MRDPRTRFIGGTRSADYWRPSRDRYFDPPGNHRDVVDVLGRAVDLHSARLLDIGCNRAWLARFVPDYWGIDTNESAVLEARRRWASLRDWSNEESARRIVLASASQLPFESASFDAVFCKDALEHLRSVDDFFSEARRVLAPRGFFVLVTPDAQAWTWDDPTHVRPYPRRAHRSLARAFGFDVVHEGYESVAPGTQLFARAFGGRSPLPIRLAARLPAWRRNVVSLFQRPASDDP